MGTIKMAQIVAVVVACVVTATATDVVIIANKDGPVGSVSNADLKRLYTGRMSEMDGTKVVPINQPLDSAVTETFLETYVGMSVQEFREYWVSQIGRASCRERVCHRV